MSDNGSSEMVIDGEELIDELVEQFDEAKASNDVNKVAKIMESARVDETAFKVKEQAICYLAKLYTEKKAFERVMGLLKDNDSFFSLIPKARTAKIVRNILDIVASVPDSLEIQVSLCRDVVTWCKAEKRTFLRQRIESRLASLLLTKGTTQEALQIINGLLRELKKLDDKQMLTEVHLTEARIYHVMQNNLKAKASLTASRTAATSIYVVPLLQAELDEMSGILQCEDGDTVTAFSYFLESFEAFDNANDPRALTVLKYMALCKVLTVSNISTATGAARAAVKAAEKSNKEEQDGSGSTEIAHLFTGKYGLKYSGDHMTAMKAVATAAEHRSLQEFKDAVQQHGKYLTTNPLISHHLDDLYDSMFESNLLKIIQPYSCIELSHVAKFIKLPLEQVERKLSQMILDGKLNGIIEQGKGHLILHEQTSYDANYARALDILDNIGQVVDILTSRSKKINIRSTNTNANAAATKAAGTKPEDKVAESAAKKDTKK